MNNILILVDMQAGFLHSEQTIALSDKMERLLERNLFDGVVGTRFTNHDNSMYEKLFQWSAMKTEEEIAIPDNLQKYMDVVVDKSGYNCVTPDFIQQLSRLNGGEVPELVYIAGVDTDCCVLAIATALFEYNIRPVVLASYCASTGGKPSHDAGLLCIKRLIGAKQIIEGELLSGAELNPNEKGI